MVAKVIPLIKLKRQLGSFDYNVPLRLIGKLKPGILVEIPFRKKEVSGLIISIENTPDNPSYKSLLRIVDKEAFLNESQIDLIKWASFYYCVSPALLTNNIIPETPKKIITAPSLLSQVALQKLTLPKTNLPGLTKILKSIEQSKKILYHWADPKNKTAIYIKLLEKFSTDGAVILIIPQLVQMLDFIKYLPQPLREKTSVLHGELNKNLYWHEWDRVRTNLSRIVIGTRQAIFSPIRKLNLAIIDEEHNISHKQWDKNPRYHSLQLATKLQEITDCKLLVASHAPRVETYHTALNENDKIITEKNNLMKTSLKNMAEERKNKNFSILSEMAREKIEDAFLNRNIPLNYINRRGTGKFALCQDCKYVPLCPNCNLALSVHKAKPDNTYELVCHHCGHRAPPPIPCPRCKSMHIKYAGTGTEKAEAELKNFFPHMKICRADVDTMSGKMQHACAVKAADMIIGTNSLFSLHFPPNIGPVIILNIDTNLQIPDFRAYENTFQLISQFKILLAGRHFSSAHIIIQTYSLENSFLKTLSCGGYEEFYETEIKNRKIMHYPPFGQLIKLTLKNKDSNIIKLEAEKILTLLKERFINDPDIEFFENDTSVMKFKKYCKEIIIKNHGASDKLQEWLIERMPAECIIDVDPIEL